MQESAYFAYDGERGRHVSFPLGGIGAGCIGLSAAGRLVDWEIANRPDKGALNGFSHFAIRAEADGRTLDTRILNGPFAGNLSGERGAGNYREFGWGVRREHLTGLPHFRRCSFRGFFPAAELTLEDPAFPGDVALLAFSPFIPMDEAASSLPVALFEFAVTNTSAAPIRYSLIGCLGNPVKGPHASRLVRSARLSGMVNSASTVPADAREFGQVMIATDRSEVSWQHEWYRGSWFDSLEVYWKDISSPGSLKDRVYDSQHVDRRLDGGGRHRGHSCLAAHQTVAPGERTVFRWAIAWYFPNVERDWLNIYGYAGEPKEMAPAWKTHYATKFADIDSIAAHTFENWDRLAGDTLRFRDALRASTLPDAVLDAVSANLSTLKSPAVLRLQDGTFYGFEGCDVTAGSCEGSCTHVWNYQQALPFLFPRLERGMRTADFAHNQDPRTGGMSFRLALPLGIGRFDIRACADGQFGNVMKAYRDWKASGDDAWLRAAVAGDPARDRVRLASAQPRSLGSRSNRRAVGPPAPHARHGAVRAQLLAYRLLPRRIARRGTDGRASRRRREGKRVSLDLRERQALGRRQSLQRQLLRSEGRHRRRRGARRLRERTRQPGPDRLDPRSVLE